jgi:hypothetical protein
MRYKNTPETIKELMQEPHVPGVDKQLLRILLEES